MPQNLQAFRIIVISFLCIVSTNSIAADLTIISNPSAPSNVNFGNVYKDVSVQLTVTLKNVNSRKTISGITSNLALTGPFRYVDGSFPGTGGTCSSSISLSPTQSCTVVIRFLSAYVSSYSSSLSFAFNLGTASTPVIGNCVYPPPTFTISRTSLNYRTRPIGSTSTINVVVRYTGVQTPSGLAITVNPAVAFSITDGYDESYFECGVGRIFNDATYCTFAITFQPAAAQAYTSTITFSLPGVEAVTLDLSGAGQTLEAKGSTDNSFGSTGMVSSDSGSTAESVTSLSFNGVENIYAAGFSISPTTETNDFVVSKYLTDGSIDTAFDGTGSKRIHFGRHATLTKVFRTNQGNLFLLGNAGGELALAQVNESTGAYNSTFFSTGRALIDLDGGSFDTCEAVYQDMFSQGFTLVGSSQKRGKLTKIAVISITNSGGFTSGYGGSGKSFIQIGNSHTRAFSSVYANGKLLVAGHARLGATYDFLVAAVGSTAGSVNTTFNSPSGFNNIDFGGTEDLATSIISTSSGKTIVAGRVRHPSEDRYGFGVARLNIDGTLDQAFGEGGKYVSALEAGVELRASVLEGANGDLFIAWYVSQDSSPSLVRITSLTAEGVLRTSFGSNGTQTTGIKINKGQIPAFGKDANGKMLIGGSVLEGETALADLVLQRFW